MTSTLEDCLRGVRTNLTSLLAPLANFYRLSGGLEIHLADGDGPSSARNLFDFGNAFRPGGKATKRRGSRDDANLGVENEALLRVDHDDAQFPRRARLGPERCGEEEQRHKSG